AVAQAHGALGQRGEIRETARATPEIFEGREGEQLKVVVALHAKERDELLRCSGSEWPERDRVDGAEDRSVGADRESEGEHRRRREARRAPQRAERKPNVGRDRGQRSEWPGFTRLV